MNYMYITCRILLAMILGLSIGLERQLTGHAAGVRINVLICMGTCFFTLFPILNGSTEVYRVTSSIISGVGFLCSSVIFKENGSVRGMNTAATLWCSAAIGILATNKNVFLSVIATAILILSNLILRPLALRINPVICSDETDKMYRISVTCLEEAEPEIRQLLITNSNASKSLFLSNLESGDVIGDKVEVVAEFCSMGKPKIHVLESMVGKTLKNPRVVRAGWEVI